MTEAVADVAADLGQLDLAQAEELARLAPFGHSNAEPLVALPGVQVQSTRVVGERHLQLTLSGNGAVADAIAFGMAAAGPARRQPRSTSSPAPRWTCFAVTVGRGCGSNTYSGRSP